MSIHAVKTERMDITISLSAGYIFVQQKWKYNWLIHPNHQGLSAWTYQEKRNFHNKSDQLIWKLWSSKAYAIMTGNSPLAEKYKNIKFPINIDIKWTLASDSSHWEVDVYKIPSGDFDRSYVSWAARKIRLDSEDIKARADLLNQVPVTHELGHSIGYSSAITGVRMDEYPSQAHPNPRYGADVASIMNHGTEVRIRHFEYLKQQLNALLPNAAFDIVIQ